MHEGLFFLGFFTAQLSYPRHTGVTAGESVSSPDTSPGFSGSGVNRPAVGRSSMNIWEQTLARIETKVNRHSFYTWFKPTTCILDGGDHLTIRVPNGLFRDWLLKHYGGIMADALAEIGRPGTLLTFVTEEPSSPFQESVSAPLPSIAPEVPDRRQRKSL